MNADAWIKRFHRNREPLAVDWEEPLLLPKSAQKALSKSLAVFQLGETGDGVNLRRHARQTREWPGFEHYEEALELFIKEENRHAADLARMVERLDGGLISTQWTASVFKVLRRPLGLRFELQVLLTAELIAEAYYELLRRAVDDGPISKACARMVKDEVGHLAFHADLFGEVLRRWTPGAVHLWTLQFQLLHAVTMLVVWWDHLGCFRALGIPWQDYRRLCRRARVSFLGRVGKASRAAAPNGTSPLSLLEPEGKTA